MKRILKCVRNTLLALLLGNNFANATGLNNEQGSASLALGYLGGEAKEYVYNGDNKLSEITWKMNNAAIINR
ncbi:omptin family outer membrane protease [Enterobacter bugandensis]